MAERSLGAYRLVSQLAVGGMAEIYTAKTAGPGGFEKLVALKVIHPNFSEDPDFVQMLVDEAKLTVQLQHANIVQTFDLGRVDGQYYIAMELVDGADLYKLLRRASERDLPFPIDVAVFIAHEVCGGLDYAHRKRDSRGRPLEIVHRDVSPQNVLVSYDGDVKIADFGIAKAARRVQQTAAGVIKGKYYYMSPEQAWGDPVDARTDVFSCGILLYEMLVGQMLYLEENMDVLLDKVRKAVIPPPSEKRPDVPTALEQIVMKALAKRPQDRFPSAGDLGTALARFARTAAPNFGKPKLSAWVKSVLQEDSGKIREGRAATAVRRDQIAQDRNSLLFKLADAQRRPAPAVGANATAVAKGPASRAPAPSTAKPAPAAVKPAAPAAARQIPVKGRPASPSPAAAPSASASADASSSGAGAAKPRAADRATSPVELPEARASQSPAKPSALASDFDDESDATIVDSDRRFSERSADDSTRPMVVSNLKSLAPSRPLVDDPALDEEDDGADHEVPTDHARSPASQFDLGDLSAPHPLLPVEPNAPVAPLDAGSSPAQDSGRRRRQSSDDEETSVEAPQRTAKPVSDDTGPLTVPVAGSWIDPYQYRPPARNPEAAEAAPSLLPPASWIPTPPPMRPSQEMAIVQSLKPRSRVLWIFLGALLVGGGVAVVPSLLRSPPPLRGALEVVSLPAGAEVVLDGKTLPTRTPLEMGDLDPASAHHVSVNLAGYEPYQSDVHFDSATPRVRLQAILVSNLGEIELRSVPTGAEVTLNGRVRGNTPLTVPELARDQDVTVDLKLRGYKVAHRIYKFAGQRRLEASVPLERGR